MWKVLISAGTIILIFNLILLFDKKKWKCCTSKLSAVLRGLVVMHLFYAESLYFLLNRCYSTEMCELLLN